MLILRNLTQHLKFYLFRAYDNLRRAANLNHSAAMELVAMAYLFGDHLPQNISKARDLFSLLSLKGSPRGQMVNITFSCYPF